MLIIISWYLAMQLFAFAAWPLAFSVCHRLPDRGYGLAKGLGLLLVAYITWLLAHMGARLPALGFSFSTVSAAWAIVLAISLFSIAHRAPDLWAFLRRRRGYVISLELVMLAAFVAMLVLRAYVPHISYHEARPMPDSIIDHAAEKFMDFAILNGLLTSSSFPPHDVWVAHQPLNYYYFGHMLWAVLVKFCSVRPEIGFNLALGTTAALTSALAFALGFNLTGRRRWGFLALFLIVISSNLDGFWQLVAALKQAVFPLDDWASWYGLDRPWWRNYDFWRSSRAIAGTINEFPAFSLLLGDLHAHLNALVINLCGWQLAVQVFRSARQYRSLWRYEVNAFDELFLIALVMGALSATNSWDVPVFFGVVALAMWAGMTGRRDPYSFITPLQRIGARLGNAASALFITGLTAVVGIIILFSPFLLTFRPPKPDEGSMIKMVAAINRTNPFEFVTHWGLLAFYPFALVCIALRARRPRASNDQNAAMATWAMILLVMAAGFVLLPVWQGWIVVLSASTIIILSALLALRHLPPITRFVTGLVLLFACVVWFCELYYVDDVFEGPIERINTVFKTYYALWPMMAVATILSMRMIIRTGLSRNSQWSRRRRTWVMIAPLIIAGAPYIFLGSIHRVTSATRLGQWTPPPDSPNLQPPAAFMKPEARAKNIEEALDGMRYLAYTQPDDYATMMWIRANLPPSATILEGAGSQYVYAGRMSTMTGRPAFAGWLNHALGWRGRAAFGNEQMRRFNRTADIYLDADAEKTLMMLQEEKIDYVIVGTLEHQLYIGMNESKFDQLGEKIYSRGKTSVYRISPNQTPSEKES